MIVLIEDAVGLFGGLGVTESIVFNDGIGDLRRRPVLNVRSDLGPRRVKDAANATTDSICPLPAATIGWVLVACLAHTAPKS